MTFELGILNIRYGVISLENYGILNYIFNTW